MLYYFVINDRHDLRRRMDAELIPQIHALDVPYKTYFTQGVGDATRFVRIYCDLHPADEVCFVACGGTGTLHEVASGVVGFSNKCIAYLAYGQANDFAKHFPGRDFTSLPAVLAAKPKKVDIIKVNDFYSINVANAGFDSMVAGEAMRLNEERGVDIKKAYNLAVYKSILFNRYNRINVVADGEKIGGRYILMAAIANASWYGEHYHCAPQALIDDGLMDLVVFKPASIFTLAKMIKHYEDGTHLTDGFCADRLYYRRVKHVELTSKDLIYMRLDGELLPSTHIEIDVLPQAVTIMLP